MRKSKYKTDYHPAKARELSNLGLSQKEIAQYFRIAEGTLYEWFKQFPELEESLKKGRSEGLEIVTNALMEKAKKGDTTAIIFYLKCRAQGFNDKQVIEVDDKREDKRSIDLSKMSDKELIKLMVVDNGKKTTKRK